MNWIKKNVRDTLLVIAIILSIYASVVGTVALNNDDNQSGMRVGTYVPTVVSPSITNSTLTSGKIVVSSTGGLQADGVVQGSLESLNADAIVVASDAPAAVIAYATVLQAGGGLVWVCDGTSDEVQINAAIATLTTGGVVYLTTGHFYIAAPITIADLDNITLEGTGRSKTSGTSTAASYNFTTICLANNSNCNMINVTHSTRTSWNIIIQHMTLWGNYSNQTSGEGISLNTSISKVIDVSVEWVKNDAFHLTAPNYATETSNGTQFRDVYVRETNGNAWEADSYVYDTYFENCYVSGVRGAHDAWYISGGGGFRFNFCEMDNCEQRGIALISTSKVRISNCSFSAAMTGSQVYIYNSNQIIVTANNFYPGSLSNYPIEFGAGGSCDMITIDGNIFFQGSRAIRTYVSVFTNCAITNNIFKGQNSSPPIYDISAMSSWFIKNNTGYIVPGEIRTYSGSLVAGLVGLPVMAWQNPNSTALTVTARTLITTPSTAAAVGDLGRATTVAVVEDAEDVWNEAFASTVTLTNKALSVLTESGAAITTGGVDLHVTTEGAFTAAVPSGYTATATGDGTGGYVTVSGSPATLVDGADITVTGTGHILVTVTSVCTNAVNTTYVERGTNCVAFTVPVTVDTNDLVAVETHTSLDLSTVTYLLLKLRATTTTAAGDYQLLLDDTAGCASPLYSYNLPVMTANTTALVCLAVNGGAVGAGSSTHIGLKYTDAHSVANVIYIDDIRGVTVGTELFNDLALNSTAYTSADSVTASAPLYVGAKNSDGLDCIIMYSQTQATTDLVGTYYVTAQGQ
jgi:hypothetical protein